MITPSPADIPPPPTAAPKASPNEPASTTSELLRQTREARSSAMALLGNVQSVVGLANDAVREQLHARPYLTMGAAAGAGYVLAGGLASTVTKQLLRAGTKAATAYVVGIVLQKVTEGALPTEGAAPADPA